MNKGTRDMMWLTAAGFVLMGLVACVTLGFSFAYIGLFILGLLFFVIGFVVSDQGLV